MLSFKEKGINCIDFGSYYTPTPVFTTRNETLSNASVMLTFYFYFFLPLATKISHFKNGKHYFVHIWFTGEIMVL